MGAVPRETATVERLQHVPAEAVREIAGDSDTARQEIKQSYFDIWREHWSEKQFNAGDMFRKRYYHANMVALGSRDYRQPYLGGGAHQLGSIFPQNEQQEHSRSLVRNARAALGHDGPAFVTEAVIIDEADPIPIIARLTKRKDKAQCRAVAIEFIKLGLDRLVKHWGLDGKRV